MMKGFTSIIILILFAISPVFAEDKVYTDQDLKKYKSPSDTLQPGEEIQKQQEEILEKLEQQRKPQRKSPSSMDDFMRGYRAPSPSFSTEETEEYEDDDYRGDGYCDPTSIYYDRDCRFDYIGDGYCSPIAIYDVDCEREKRRERERIEHERLEREERERRERNWIEQDLRRRR